MLAEGHAVLVQEAAQVVEDEVGGVGAEPVDLVEDDEGDLGVPGEGAEVALVEGGVGVLLGVHDPDDGVDQAEDPVDLVAVGGDGRVVVGQVHEDEALELGVTRAAREGPAAQPVGDGEPVEQSGGALGPAERDGRGGGGAAQAGLGDGDAGEGVEERGLAASGGSRDGDDGVPGGEPLAGGGLVQDAPGLGEGVALHARA